MPKDTSITTNLAMTMNPLLHSHKSPTKDKIRAIIKNQNGDQLLFKDKSENWEPITTRRLDRCELKYLIKECIKQVLPTTRIDQSLLSLQSVKTLEFHVHEYIFELKMVIPNDAEVRLPRTSSYTDFKWLSESKPKPNKLKNNTNIKKTEDISSKETEK